MRALAHVGRYSRTYLMPLGTDVIMCNTFARTQRQAGDLAGANAASAAAANFYSKAGIYGESKSSELAELDRRILEVAASRKAHQEKQAVGVWEEGFPCILLYNYAAGSFAKG